METLELKSTTSESNTVPKDDSFSLTRRCGFALAWIEKAVVTLGHSLSSKKRQKRNEKTQQLQDRVGGMILRHFSSSIQSSEKEIGLIGINLAAVRREMETEREKEKEIARKAEEERQSEFSRKMREIEEMKKMNEELIEEGRQRREEKMREEERKRKEEEEERRRNVKEGTAAIEVFARDCFTIAGNVFTKRVSDHSSFFSLTFGPVVVRITFVIRKKCINYSPVGLIAADLVEQATQDKGYFSNLKRAASWQLLPDFLYTRQHNKESHRGSACKRATVGQRVVMEADGREGKRTLKLSQDGETQPVFFSNIPVPFRFAILMFATGASVEIVSSEVLGEASMVGGSVEVVMD
ncbi:hypothetical protein BLNAU_12145 [Blattamonas nauphoetae]|uniref:Uncharacterized protein n=1 Tax=Blattamonas nauphoetae TaxID=2049346 RepID=A0ABQ9XMI3_9EUKA|nr:hypothetical protein BLNAU_12145 [Blattamonas nauphoetae]